MPKYIRPKVPKFKNPQISCFFLTNFTSNTKTMPCPFVSAGLATGPINMRSCGDSCEVSVLLQRQVLYIGQQTLDISNRNVRTELTARPSKNKTIPYTVTGSSCKAYTRRNAQQYRSRTHNLSITTSYQCTVAALHVFWLICSLSAPLPPENTHRDDNRKRSLTLLPSS